MDIPLLANETLQIVLETRFIADRLRTTGTMRWVAAYKFRQDHVDETMVEAGELANTTAWEGALHAAARTLLSTQPGQKIFMTVNDLMLSSRVALIDRIHQNHYRTKDKALCHDARALFTLRSIMNDRPMVLERYRGQNPKRASQNDMIALALQTMNNHKHNCTQDVVMDWMELPDFEKERHPAPTTPLFSSRAEVHNGRPLVRDTQTPVRLIFDKLIEGQTLDQILFDHPELYRQDVVTFLNRACIHLEREMRQKLQEPQASAPAPTAADDTHEPTTEARSPSP